MSDIRKSMWACGAAVAVVAVAQPAMAQQRSFDVPAQAIETAIPEFARQAGVQIVAPADGLRGFRSKRIKGSMEVRDGLRRLIAGSGLVIASDQNGVILLKIQRPSAGRDQSGTTETATSLGDDDVAEEEIIVTAQRRDERLIDVPISISVISGDALDSSPTGGVNAAITRVPGVALDSIGQGGSAAINIRGVGASGPLFGASATAGYYLDDAPFGLVKSALVPDASVYDLERIEVLRGPQGTLYGASSMSGVVRVLTSEPNFGGVEAKGRLSISDTKGGGTNYRGDAALNVPIIDDRLAMRAVIGYEEFGGWIDTPNKQNYNKGSQRNVRLKVGAKPTDDLSINLSAWHFKSDFDGGAVADSSNNRNALFAEPIDIGYDIYSGKISYDFGGAVLTATTSYLEYSNRGTKRSAFSANYLETYLTSNVFTQEVGLASTGSGPFRWSIGGIYRDGEDRLSQASGALPLTTGSLLTYADRTNSYAIFGEVGHLLTEQLEITLGLRYFHDRVNNEDLKPAATPWNQFGTFDALTPRVLLTWRPTRDFTAYASYAQGFRSGFPQNRNQSATFPPLEPDKLHNFEVGAKGNLFDNVLSFEAAAYYIKWDDIQQVIGVPVGGTFFSAATNASGARGPGAEVTITVRPTAGMAIGGSFGWNDLTFDDETRSFGIPLFLDGERLNRSPKYTFGGYLDYKFPLGDGSWEGAFSLSGNYHSQLLTRGITTLAGPRSIGSGDSQFFSRASFSLGRSDQQWAITLFADNLNNERSSDSPYLSGLLDEFVRPRPRTIGLQLDFKM